MWVTFKWAQKYLPMQEASTMTAKTGIKKTMYLTFDDGPSKNTQKVLDILDEYHVKATFFVTGSNPKYYNDIKKAYDKGHGIAIHTFSHDYKKIYSSEDAYFKDVDKMNALIKEQIGHPVKALRFPGGSSNTVSRNYQNKIMSVLTQAVLSKGYQYYDWNASNGDGNCYASSAVLISTAKKEVHGKNEVMMLMHDGTGNNATIKALPVILKDFIDQGYVFKIIDDTTAEAFHHHIAN